jgi:hypothetical protein
MAKTAKKRRVANRRAERSHAQASSAANGVRVRQPYVLVLLTDSYGEQSCTAGRFSFQDFPAVQKPLAKMHEAAAGGD